MKDLIAVTLYTLDHLLVPGVVLLIIHLIITGIANPRWYRIGSYFILCGLWIVYAHILAKHDGMQKFAIYMSFLGSVIIGCVMYLINRLKNKE